MLIAAKPKPSSSASAIRGISADICGVPWGPAQRQPREAQGVVNKHDAPFHLARAKRPHPKLFWLRGMADPWQFEDSSGSGDDRIALARRQRRRPASMAPPQPPSAAGALPRKRRGRPPGKTPEERRQAQLQHSVAYARQVAQQRRLGAFGQAPPRGLRVFLRPAGSRAQQLLTAAAAANLDSGARVNPRIDELMEHFLGDLAKPTLSGIAEAAFLGRSRRWLPRDAEALAAAVFFGCRAVATSVISHVTEGIRSGRLRGIAVIRFCQYDETPLQFSTEHALRNRLAALGDATSCSNRPQKKQTCNVFQTDFRVVLLVCEKSSGKYLALTMPLACSLSCSDRAVAPAIRALTEEQSTVPLLRVAVGLFPYCIDLRTMDSAAANLAAEHGRAIDAADTLHLAQPCLVHALSIVQGRLYAPISPVISGLISFALAQRPGGATKVLRDAIAHILRQSVTHVHARPPRDSDPRIVYRDSCSGQ